MTKTHQREIINVLLVKVTWRIILSVFDCQVSLLKSTILEQCMHGCLWHSWFVSLYHVLSSFHSIDKTTSWAYTRYVTLYLHTYSTILNDLLIFYKPIEYYQYKPNTRFILDEFNAFDWCYKILCQNPCVLNRFRIHLG